MARTHQAKHRVFRTLSAGLVTALAVATGSGMAGAVAAPRTHVVKAGETLSAIGRTYGIPLDRLIEANGPINPHRIFPGDHLILPDAPSISGPASEPASPPINPMADRSHIVQSGETASGIARKYGISLRDLVQHNNLADSNRIRAGQRLEIPPLMTTSTTETKLEGAPNPIPQPPAAIDTRLDDVASRHGLDPVLVKALAWHRSRWGVDAVGPSGERGALQISPATLDWVEQRIVRRPLDAEHADDTLEGGVALLGYLMERSPDEKHALAAYLQGFGSVQRAGIRPATAQAVDEIQQLKQRFGTTNATDATSIVERRLMSLEERVVATIASVAGPNSRVGVAAVNLSTGERLSIRGAESFPAASVLKLPIMVEVYRQLAHGTVKTDSQLRALVRDMIVVSDNHAANRLIKALGQDNINRSLDQLGLSSTHLHNPFGTRPGDVDSGFNQTTPDDMLALLGLLADDQLVNPAASREMRGLLEQVRDGSKIRRSLPSDVVVAHKSGWFEGVSNDVGIVQTAKGTYLIAVFAHGPFGYETGNQIVGAVSGVVFEEWGR